VALIAEVRKASRVLARVSHKSVRKYRRAAVACSRRLSRAGSCSTSPTKGIEGCNDRDWHHHVQPRSVSCLFPNCACRRRQLFAQNWRKLADNAGIFKVPLIGHDGSRCISTKGSAALVVSIDIEVSHDEQQFGDQPFERPRLTWEVNEYEIKKELGPVVMPRP
jgi:hypothetical protein